MATFFSSFPSAEVKPANVNIGDMVNTLRGAQAYKSGEISLEQATVANEEQRKIAEALKQDPALFMTDNRLDIDKINKIIPQLAPRTGQKYLQEYGTLHKAQTEAIKAKLGLSQDIKSVIGTPFRILGEVGVPDPNAYIAAGENLKKQYPDLPDVHKYIDAALTPFRMVKEPGPAVAQMAIQGAQSLLTPAQAEDVFGVKTGTMNLGTDIMQTTTKAMPGGLPATVTVGPQLGTAQVTPSQYYADTGRVDMNNQPIYRVISKTGQVLGEITVPGGVPPSQLPGGPAAPQPNAPQAMPGGPMAPQAVPQAGPQPIPQAGPQPTPAMPTNAPARMPAGETPATLDAATKLRLDTRAMAQQVPVQQFNSNQIIKLADDVISGKGAGTIANLTGGYAALNGLGIGGENATNLQQLGHYMAQQTQALSAGTGLANTDAGRALAGQMAGDIQWTPQAIKQTARVNRALSTGTELFAQGVNNAFERTKNPFAAAEFQQRWSQTLGNDGINAIRLYDAIRNKDNEAIKEVATQAAGPDYRGDILKAPGYLNLVNKITQMQRLIGGK